MQLALIELTAAIPLQQFKMQDNDGCLVSYISKSMRNKYISLSCKEQTMHNHMLLILDETYDCIDEKSDDLQDNIDFKVILGSLTELQKKVIIFKYYYEYSDNEIAKMLGISRQAVNRLKNRGIEKLRNLF